MGIYGAGKAFNLRYAQNTFVPNRGINVRQSRQPIMFGSHCHCAPTNTNITINNGPTGFWGFMSGLFGGLFGGGGMMGMGGMFGGFNPFGGMFNMLGGLFGGNSPFGALNAQQAQPQQPQGNNELANLEKMYSKYKVLPNGNGTYTITKGEGDNVKTGTYDELIKGLDQPEKKVDNENDKVNNDKPKVDDDTTGGKKVDDDTAGGKTKVDDSTTGGGKAGGVQGSGSGVKSSGGSGIKKGWYRAANDNSATIQASKGKNASQLTSNLLGTKLMGVLTKQQQAELRQEIIKQNPSVFDENGNPKPNADYSRLDVPTMAYIEQKFGINHGAKVARQDDQYSGTIKHKAKNGDYVKQDKNGKYSYYDANGQAMTEKAFKAKHPTINTTNIKKGGYSSQKGTRVQSKTGRYAEKSGNGWKYFAQDGTQLNEAHIKKNDPELWNKTHPRTTNNMDVRTYGMGAVVHNKY